MKTHQATAKRLKVTKTGKVMKRKNGHGHFNSRESGNTTRMKRRDVGIDPVYHRAIKQLLNTHKKRANRASTTKTVKTA